MLVDPDRRSRWLAAVKRENWQRWEKGAVLAEYTLYTIYT